ncbi:MAG: hypothetical protein Q8O70_12990 [Burkholderiales bacterium]|nr:hypothetical protein [Burkholderiales bacterium]
MEFLKDAWPWWAGGCVVAVIMHFAVKRAKISLAPEHLVAIQNQIKTRTSGLIAWFLKFAIAWVILLVIATIVLVVFLRK